MYWKIAALRKLEVAATIWPVESRVNAMPPVQAVLAAKAAGVPLVDLTKYAADYYEKLGREKVDEFFPNRLRKDTTHFTAAAADLNAAFVVAGLKELPGNPFAASLSAKGRAVSQP